MSELDHLPHVRMSINGTRYLGKEQAQQTTMLVFSVLALNLTHLSFLLFPSLSGKYLITCSPGEKPRFVVYAIFHGIDTPSLADFRLPT